jgi:hypothetical protein
MGLAKELETCRLSQATMRDVESVQITADVVMALFDFLLQMDFRNSPLCCRFDEIKYCVKALEKLLCELAMTSPALPSIQAVVEEHNANKQPKLDLIPMAELQALS